MKKEFPQFHCHVCVINCIEIADSMAFVCALNQQTVFAGLPEDLFQIPFSSPPYTNEISNFLAFRRYTFDKSALATTVSKDALDVSFWHQPTDSLQLGGSFIFNKRTSKAIGSFCYQLEMKDTTIKGMIDSDWTIGCTYNR